MYKLVCLTLALVSSCTAFAPAGLPARTATRQASTKNLDGMIGGDVETGGAWDPLGFSQIGDYGEKYGEGIKGLGDGVFPHVKWLREAEIKHGRVCMLAFMGIWGYSVLGPMKGAFGADKFYNGMYYEQVPWDQAIASSLKTNPVGLIQVIAVIAIIEGNFFPGDFWGGAGEREAGDHGLRWYSKKKDLEKMKLSELKNGRLAMIGMASLGAAYAVPGSVPVLTATMPNL